MNPVAIRLLSQQLISPQFDDPAQVVSYFGAMQAQEYRQMRWAVAMRTRKPSAEVFKKAYDEGRIIRLHLLRGTWQLISAEDYNWMMTLCAPRGYAVTKGWMSSQGFDIPETEIEKVQQVFINSAQLKRSITKEELAAALAENGIILDDRRMTFHLRIAEYNGILCSGDLLPMKPTYSLVSSKIPVHSEISEEEALAILARKYYQSHSPATLEDFVWWSGLNISQCRKAIQIIAREVHEEKWNDRIYIIHNGCRTRGFRKGGTHLIPAYDEYLIGYKSRDIVLDPKHKHRAHNNSGIFKPVIAQNGIICGNWKPFGGDNAIHTFLEDVELTKLGKEQMRYNRFNIKHI